MKSLIAYDNDYKSTEHVINSYLRNDAFRLKGTFNIIRLSDLPDETVEISWESKYGAKTVITGGPGIAFNEDLGFTTYTI